MSANNQEKYIQIGKLVEEYCHISGELDSCSEKLRRAQTAYNHLGQSQSWMSEGQMQVKDGTLSTLNMPVLKEGQMSNLTDLLNEKELASVILERNHRLVERATVQNRLTQLAPGLRVR